MSGPPPAQADRFGTVGRLRLQVERRPADDVRPRSLQQIAHLLAAANARWASALG